MDEETRIRIYIDGETAASIDFMLLLAHGVGGTESDEVGNIPWGTKRMQLVVYTIPTGYLSLVLLKLLQPIPMVGPSGISFVGLRTTLLSLETFFYQKQRNSNFIKMSA